jgi:hypothetical protein
MSAKEAVMRIESAAQHQGLDEAVKVMRAQINELNAMPGDEGQQQLAMVAEQLQRDGLLPDLAIQFALTEGFNSDGSFDTDDLYRYQSDKDPLTRKITDNLIQNYENLRDEHGDWGLFPQDWDGLDWVTKSDLENAAGDLRNKKYDFGIAEMTEEEITKKRADGGDWFDARFAAMEKMARQLAEQQWQRQNPEIEVQPGEGFDRIARRALEQHQGKATEADVLEYSRRLAEQNQKDRDTSILHPGDRLRLPYIESLRTDN